MKERRECEVKGKDSSRELGAGMQNGVLFGRKWVKHFMENIHKHEFGLRKWAFKILESDWSE